MIENENQYFGYGIANKFIDAYEKIDPWTYVILKAWIVSITVSLTPIFYRLAYGK